METGYQVWKKLAGDGGRQSWEGSAETQTAAFSLLAGALDSTATVRLVTRATWGRPQKELVRVTPKGRIRGPLAAAYVEWREQRR